MEQNPNHWKIHHTVGFLWWANSLKTSLRIIDLPGCGRAGCCHCDLPLLLRLMHHSSINVQNRLACWAVCTLALRFSFGPNQIHNENWDISTARDIFVASFLYYYYCSFSRGRALSLFRKKKHAIYQTQALHVVGDESQAGSGQRVTDAKAKNLPLCVSLSLSLSLPISLFLCVCARISFCLSVCVPLCVCLCVCASLCVPLCVCLSVCASPPLFLVSLLFCLLVSP